MRRFILGGLAWLTVYGLPSAQTPPSVRPRPGRPACRIYATSATETTTAGPVTNVLTTKATFDPGTAKLSVDATFQSNQGARFALTLVSTYASAADFVNEVVRSSGGNGTSTAGQPALKVNSLPFEANDAGRGVYISAGWADHYRLLSSVAPRGILNVSGAAATATQGRAFWSINTVPPISLVQTNEVSGDQHATMTNTFNAAGQVTQSVQAQSTGSDTTTYTAWDQFGRPTAGTLVAASGTRTTITLSYDDLRRMSTWRGTHDGITNAITRSFDENGVPTKQADDRATTIIDNHDFAVQCTGAVRQPPPLPPSSASAPPRVGGPSGTFTGTIAGAGWSAKQGVGGRYREVKIGEKTVPMVAVSGTNEDYSFELSVLVTDGPGEYTTDIDPSAEPALTPAQQARGTADIMVTAAKGAAWTSAPAKASGPGYGTVQITAVSSTAVSGTFTVTLVPLPGSGAAGNRMVSGTFTIQF